MNPSIRIFCILYLSLSIGCQPQSDQSKSDVTGSSKYEDLVNLFKEWRDFEMPPLRNGAPDYTKEMFEKRRPDFEALRLRLMAIDTSAWSVPRKADWYIVWAEMNGYDFNQRVLKPWERDPAFYKTLWTERSDVPAHEGPAHHAVCDIWKYSFPLSPEDENKLISELSVIPPLNNQAKINLTGNAKDLWIAGTRDIRTQSQDLKNILDLPGVADEKDLVNTIQAAITSTDNLVLWLEAQSQAKTGPSGIGKEEYTWYQQNVHLLPLTWDDEVMILKRELARAWYSLELEEQHNRNLPQLTSAETPEEFDERAEKAFQSMMDFFVSHDIITVKDYFGPALHAHIGSFTPKETRNFFAITAHHDPRPLLSHSFHWIELARMENEPNSSEIRRGPLLYNIWDNRSEGLATTVEELFMQAGLYEDSPRSREIVYIMIAQRAARGLGSLYAQANLLTMEEASKIHADYTPRGWMKNEPELLKFEQHLYLRQPGYGTSYITGKYLIENTIADYARMKEIQNEPFRLKDFMDQFAEIGPIPVSLGHWEMTGVHEKPGYIVK